MDQDEQSDDLPDTQPLDNSQEGDAQEADTQPLEQEEGDIEEGELEEGEIDEEPSGEGEQKDQQSKENSQEQQSQDQNGTATVAPKEKEEDNDSSDQSEDSDDARKERKRKRKSKKKKKKEEKEKKKKRKKTKYMDYDRMEDDFQGEAQPGQPGWPGSGYPQRQSPYTNSPPGPYDSPDDENSSPRRGYEQGNKYDQRSPHDDPYGDVYGSPRGPYDSPSDGEDYGQPPRKLSKLEDNNQGRSLMSMLDDEYMDATVAANEKQDVFDRAVRGPPNPRKQEKKRHYQELHKQRQSMEMQRQISNRPVCKFFKDGKCSKGEDCQYSHDFTPVKKPEICKFYLISVCNKGSDCRYMHGDYPCKFFHAGKDCYQGDNCKFSHQELTDETRPILERLISQEKGGNVNTPAVEEGDEFGSPKKKPSLLGSPPRHLKEQLQEKLDHMKKIPSLFDIQVFPPGQRPPGLPTSNSGPGPRPRPMGSPLGGPMPPGLLGPPGRMPGPGMPSPGTLPGNQPPSFYRGFYGGPKEENSSQKPTEEGTNKGESEDKENEKNVGDASEVNGEGNEDKKEQSYDIPSHLPPKQRELFLRIQQQQKREAGNKPPEQQDGGFKDDEKWYSSDEEEGNTNKKLADMIKSIRQQPAEPQGPPVQKPPPPIPPGPPRLPLPTPHMLSQPPPGMFGPPGFPPPPRPPVNKIDIATMLNVIRSAAGGPGPGGPGVRVTMNSNRDPRAGGLPGTSPDPRAGAATVPGSMDPRSLGGALLPKPADPRGGVASVAQPVVHPEPTIIYSKPGSVAYDLKEISVEKRPILSLPSNIHPMDPRLPKLQQEVIKSSSKQQVAPAAATKREDPRSAGKDPRLQRQGSRAPQSPPQDDISKSGSTDLKTDSNNGQIVKKDPRSHVIESKKSLVEQRPKTDDVKSGDPRSHSMDIRSPGLVTSTAASELLSNVSPVYNRTLSDSTSVAIQQLAALMNQKPNLGSLPNLSLPDLGLPGLAVTSSSVVTRKDPRANRMSTSNSENNSTSTTGSQLNYRNDPRFRKKPKSSPGFQSPNQSNTAQDTENKEEPENYKQPQPPQVTELRTDLSARRGNLEHSSPLGGGTNTDNSGNNSYNSYNRPPNSMNNTRTGPHRTFSHPSNLSKPQPLMSTASGQPPGRPSEEEQFVLPPVLLPELPVQPNLAGQVSEQPPPLKDVFKTMDPTASPFC